MGIRYNIPEPPKDLITGTQERMLWLLMAINHGKSTLPRKAVCISEVTVPQTDTGRWVEYTKALE